MTWQNNRLQHGHTRNKRFNHLFFYQKTKIERDQEMVLEWKKERKMPLIKRLSSPYIRLVELLQYWN